MKNTILGSTGIQVSQLGMGLAEIGSAPFGIDEARGLLNSALDAGITFLDSAACYGASEELLGKTIADRRSEFILATKCGHITGDYSGQEWSRQTVTDSIDRSLTRLKTDYLDLVQLHSCETAILQSGEAIEALIRAKEAGKTRFIGYSGDNEAAEWAVNSDIFSTLQTSFSLVEQKARRHLLGLAKSKGMGIIIKRPIGNGVWGAKVPPSEYSREYYERAQAMKKEGNWMDEEADPIKLALAFTFSHPEVDTAIVGTRNLAHLLSNIRMLEESIGLSPATKIELHRRFDKLGANWHQLT